MNTIKELENLIKSDVLIEINENINELNEQIKKKSTKALKEELTYMLEVKKYFDEVLVDIENNALSEEDAEDILEGLDDMRVENDI